MSEAPISDLTRPLYSYVPEYIHVWLDEVKADTELNKSDIVNLSLEIMKKSFSNEQLVKFFDEFLILGEKGLPQVSTIE